MRSGKNFTSIVIVCLALLSGGCSFKKNTSPKVVQVFSPTVKVSTKTLDQLFQGSEDQEIIDALSQRFVGISERIDQVEPSLLDLSVHYGRPKVAAYLIFRGFSPFVLSDASFRILEFDNKVGIVLSAQKDKIQDLLWTYPSLKNNVRKYEDFEKAVQYLSLGVRGCQLLVESLFNIRHFTDKSVAYSLYNAAERSIQTDEAIRFVLSETECKLQSNAFSIDSVQDWMAHEFMFQFQSNFKKIEFSRWLSQKFLVDSINIVVPNAMQLGASQIKVDPVAMVLLKSLCVEDEPLFLE